eukprot:CCRYP_020450-RA/>CCRYP_020450-RA protein AED:0.40 eAED:0.37 QI:0/0/0/0.66/0/0/3/0/180
MLHAVLNDETDNAYGKELRHLAQGLPGIVKGTDTIVFIQKNKCPSGPLEGRDPYRIRLTVGGNRINFPGDCGTPTEDMIIVKILLNSVISTKNAKFMTIDIKDLYLNTPMAHPEFMQLNCLTFPPTSLISTNFVALHVMVMSLCTFKRACILPQARIIAHNLANGYHQSKINPGFWMHEW